jgi:hypothetical protein
MRIVEWTEDFDFGLVIGVGRRGCSCAQRRRVSDLGCGGSKRLARFATGSYGSCGGWSDVDPVEVGGGRLRRGGRGGGERDRTWHRSAVDSGLEGLADWGERGFVETMAKRRSPFVDADAQVHRAGGGGEEASSRSCAPGLLAPMFTRRDVLCLAGGAGARRARRSCSQRRRAAVSPSAAARSRGRCRGERGRGEFWRRKSRIVDAGGGGECRRVAGAGMQARRRKPGRATRSAQAACGLAFHCHWRPRAGAAKSSEVAGAAMGWAAPVSGFLATRTGSPLPSPSGSEPMTGQSSRQTMAGGGRRGPKASRSECRNQYWAEACRPRRPGGSVDRVEP